jgi:hypothetical protein
MIPSTPGAKIPRWGTRLCSVWLIKIGDYIVHTIKDAQLAFKTLQDEGHTHVALLFAHLEVHPDISRRGLPIVSMALFTQMNNSTNVGNSQLWRNTYVKVQCMNWWIQVKSLM